MSVPTAKTSFRRRMATPTPQACWRISRAPQGVLAAIDQEQFAAYVVHADVFVEAAKAEVGQPLIDDKGFVAPLLRPMRQTSRSDGTDPE
jgi:hypothetical protein